MADQLPVNFPLPGEQALANYDYNDIQEGYGYTTYYLSSLADSSGTSYLMSRDQIYSRDIDIVKQNVGGTDETFTFYSPAFNLPRIMKGTALINFAMRGARGTAGQTFIAKIKLYHYDGSTSTQLNTTWQSETVTFTGSYVTTNFTAYIPITTEKRFKKGDQIKLELLLTYDLSSGGAMDIGIDPQNRDSVNLGSGLKPSTNASDFTQFIVRIPFKIN